jgi:hypothetical protein
LAELWETGRTSRIDKRMHTRILRRPDVLNETDGSFEPILIDQDNARRLQGALSR